MLVTILFSVALFMFFAFALGIGFLFKNEPMQHSCGGDKSQGGSCNCASNVECELKELKELQSRA